MGPPGNEGLRKHYVRDGARYEVQVILLFERLQSGRIVNVEVWLLKSEVCKCDVDARKVDGTIRATTDSGPCALSLVFAHRHVSSPLTPSIAL